MSESKKRTAFILTMTANGLGIARTLGRRGIPVVGVDSKPELPGLHSRFVKPLICPDMVKDPEGVLDLLLKEGEKLNERGVLFPASDAAVLFMSRNRDKLRTRFDFIIPSEKVEEAMVKQAASVRGSEAHRHSTYRIYYPKTPADLDEVISGYIFQPSSSPSIRTYGTRRSGTKVHRQHTGRA